MDNIDRDFIAYVYTHNLDAAVALLELGADVHTRNDSALQCSAEQGYFDMVSKLLEYGANVHANHNYALRWSAAGGHLDIVSKLLEFGADVNSVRIISLSALGLSVKRNHLDVVIKLLERGVNVHARDDYALRMSAQYQRYKIMAKLLESGADVCCNDREILKELRVNFNEQMADILLPYCDTDDYKYFPIDYIRARIIPTKSANATTKKN